MRTTLTVTAKGQVTLRKGILEHLDIRPGDRVEVSLLSDGRIELRQADTRPPLSRLMGVLRRPGQRPVTIEEMQDAIEQGRDR
ncbi:AbrB/MazE/SpoVT family DNA-binding domain-containing protein [Thalassobaculum sp.]|uniref:AbrB/MazE/SpoVT family DNA-binding domain-containing protein n=1 Tax=Thalassobaculum sp. TaxID=2022740 RepID=UPI0032EC2F71